MRDGPDGPGSTHDALCDPPEARDVTHGPRPPRVLLVVSAASGAGKTTLLERILPRLVEAGLRVAAVKRTHHAVDPDPPGKDSRRLREAGACAVVLRGPQVTSVFAPTETPDAGDPGGIRAAVAAACAFGTPDLVLVEGGREVPGFPRIEVVAPGGAVVSDPATLVAVAADGGADVMTDDAIAPPGVPRFRRDDAAGIAALVTAWARG